MRTCIIVLSLLTILNVFGQTMDRRAELEISGRVNEISVSPEGIIWLVTAIGNTYYTNSIDSNWHYGVSMYDSTNESGLDNPHLERITFFNKDTAIMTGYNSYKKGDMIKNGLFWTKNGGQTWKRNDFKGNSWIYNVFADKEGRAWMGGSSGDIHYSKDFGKHWEKLKSPFNSSSRMNRIFMINDQQGITGALHNEIYTTSDNWKTNRKIETPIDQKKYEYSGSPANDRIEKVILWGQYIVVNQNGRIFFSQVDPVNWKPFTVKIVDFEPDIESKKLFALTDSLQIIQFSSPDEFKVVSDKRLNAYPIDIKVVNHSLYMISAGYEVYKVDSSRFIHIIPYTFDKKIPAPEIVRNYSNLSWGINSNQVYLSENNGQDWFRENALDFRVVDFWLISDSIAILWDGTKNNYIYSLQDHTPRIYLPVTPLNSFLESPVECLMINAGSQGCFHHFSHEVRYYSTSDSCLSSSKYYKERNQENESTIFKNSISSNSLNNSLSRINTNPAAVPVLKDFQISEQDKLNYLALVDTQMNNQDQDVLHRKKKINKAYYDSVAVRLDSLPHEVVEKILDQQEGIWSTTTNWFTIQIINKKNDTVNISRNYCKSPLPWNLPWKFEYKGLHFNCYDIGFSRLILSCLPENFRDRDIFDNSLLIMGIADYLYNE